MGGGHLTICIDGEMKVLVYQEVVSRTLTDDSEIIYKGLIKLTVIESSLKVILGHASSLIFVAAIQANTGNALRLEMSLAANLVAIDGKGGQNVQRAIQVHQFTNPSVSTRNEDRQIYIDGIIFPQPQPGPVPPPKRRALPQYSLVSLVFSSLFSFLVVRDVTGLSPSAFFALF